MITPGTAWPTDYPEFMASLNRGQPLVLMLTMGKVGSKTIGRSLEGRYPGPVVHAHSIRPQGICVPGELGPGHTDDRFRAAFNWAISGKPTRIICPVRESITRNISDFMFNYHRTRQDPQTLYTHSMDRLLQLFYAHTPHLWHAYWFDNVLKPFTGIDVYQRPAEQATIHRLGNFEVLVFRIEEDDDWIVRTVKDFLNIMTFELRQHNRAIEAGYARVYKEFRAHFFSQSLGEYSMLLASTPYARHFYSHMYPI